MSGDAVRFERRMEPDGQCMAIPVKDGPRCPRPGVYLLQLDVSSDVLWCAEHTAAVRAEHPEQILSMQSWPGAR